MKLTPGMRYFDLYHGVELKPETEGPFSVLSFSIEANGYGAILATPGEPSAAIKTLMQRMATMTAKPLASLSHEPTVLSQHLVEIAATKPAADAPEGMVKIPGGPFVFRVRGTEIEGGASKGVDVQYPWEDSPRRFHEHAMEVKPFFIDKFPVTNAQFKKFVDATHYAPRDAGQLSARLEGWKLSARMGQPSGHLGFARRCAGLRGVGGQEVAARMGVAVGSAGYGRQNLSLGK